MKEKTEAFERLLNIMDELREKCPWDRKQTMESLRHLTIEETYELTDSIIENDPDKIKKELGDLLLHIVFYAKIGSETGLFDIKDVIDSLCEKLIHRHPHIYGDVKVTSDEEVKQNWEQLKLKEGNKSVLAGVSKSIPAMIKAMRVQEKARAAGFDWENKDQVWEKVLEELEEFKAETDVEQPNQKRVEHELGDLFFALINYSRFIDINPEEALERTNLTFIKRFKHVEERANENGQKMVEMTLAEMDVYWNEAKELERNGK
ncbi:MAG: nucleoside triphosphate pyrophosphohydrolase [Bacteroidota bacterium]